MIHTLLAALALALALGGAAAAGLLALALEAPWLGSGGSAPRDNWSEALALERGVQGLRAVLLVVAGVAAAWLIGRTERPPASTLGGTVVAVGLLLVVADTLPRMVAGLAPELAGTLALAARRALAGLSPLVSWVPAAERVLERLLPAGGAPGAVLGAAQRDILLGVFSLGDATVMDVLTPRLDIVALEIQTSWGEVLEAVRRSEHSRLPVYAGTLDNIAGVLRAKDLVAAAAGVSAPPPRWQDLVRPVLFVPESKTLAALLRDFQRGRGEMAIVVDEFGGTSGLVTLEDILEEVVGEIHDEFDQEQQPEVRQEGTDRFWVSGRLPVDELSRLLGAPLEQEGVSTVGGLIYAVLGRVPRPGEELELAGFRVVVEQVARRRVKRVYFERLPAGTLEVGAEPEER